MRWLVSKRLASPAELSYLLYYHGEHGPATEALYLPAGLARGCDRASSGGGGHDGQWLARGYRGPSPASRRRSARDRGLGAGERTLDRGRAGGWSGARPCVAWPAVQPTVGEEVGVGGHHVRHRCADRR